MNSSVNSFMLILNILQRMYRLQYGTNFCTVARLLFVTGSAK